MVSITFVIFTILFYTFLVPFSNQSLYKSYPQLFLKCPQNRYVFLLNLRINTLHGYPITPLLIGTVKNYELLCVFVSLQPEIEFSWI